MLNVTQTKKDEAAIENNSKRTYTKNHDNSNYCGLTQVILLDYFVGPNTMQNSIDLTLPLQKHMTRLISLHYQLVSFCQIFDKLV